MEQLELDEEYLLPLVEPEDMSEMFSGIIERLCKPQKLDEDEYLGMLIDYLIYINSRDKIGKIYIMVSSRLKDTKIISKTLEGEFLNYKQIIPTTFETSIIINKSQFENALQTSINFQIAFLEYFAEISFHYPSGKLWNFFKKH